MAAPTGADPPSGRTRLALRNGNVVNINELVHLHWKTAAVLMAGVVSVAVVAGGTVLVIAHMPGGMELLGSFAPSGRAIADSIQS
jgi:hypothetical protein